LHVGPVLEAKGKVFLAASMPTPTGGFVNFLLLYLTPFLDFHLHQFCNLIVICLFFWHKEPTTQTSKCLVFVRFTTKVETLSLFKENVISFGDKTHCKQECGMSDCKVERIKFFWVLLESFIRWRSFRCGLYVWGVVLE